MLQLSQRKGKSLSKLILGIDAGNFKGKVIGPYGADSFRTNICEWFERDVEETFGHDDMEFEIAGRKGYAGSIALYEDEFSNGAMYGDSKAHEDTKIRVLLAIYRYVNRYCPNIKEIALVTGQPIKKHKESEKAAIRDMLLGTHSIIVNNERKSFTITNVGVAPEGSSAFWSNPESGTVRIIDAGSGTVNAATIIDNRHINNSSTTFNFGLETMNNKDDSAAIARGIVRSTTKLKWGNVDNVWICGGAAESIAPHIQAHYKNATVIKPVLRVGRNVTILEPTFSNAVGFYELAKGAFS